jgi:hypothetical protein
VSFHTASTQSGLLGSWNNCLRANIRSITNELRLKRSLMQCKQPYISDFSVLYVVVTKPLLKFGSGAPNLQRNRS